MYVSTLTVQGGDSLVNLLFYKWKFIVISYLTSDDSKDFEKFYGHLQVESVTKIRFLSFIRNFSNLCLVK